jgi:hypothetical protein
MLQTDFLRVTFDGRHVRSEWSGREVAGQRCEGKKGQGRRGEAGGLVKVVTGNLG